VHIDPYVALAGFIVGFTVGLTGMGGGALMTPILVLLFKVQPLAAVSSDLVAALVMKPVGAGVHMRRGTVQWDLVRWLCVGSVPAAFCGVLILRALGDGAAVEGDLKIILGVALVVAASSIVAKSAFQAHEARVHQRIVAEGGTPPDMKPFVVKPLPTVLIGVLGGLVVGMTSVGSGSLIIEFLLVFYPMLKSRELVGTDLVQAIPLVAAAALGHILFGEFQLSLTTSILIGSLPGVYVGARLSSRAPDAVIRPALVFVLVASGLKLLGVETGTLGWMLLALTLVALPVWGAIDAAMHPRHTWAEVGRSRSMWVGSQALTAPLGIGFFLAIAYFATTRPALASVAALGT
jgi:uncharacterized membrane protein YfcA